MTASNRILASCFAFSLLLHAVALLLASAVPVRLPRPGDVLVMDLTDIPRAVEFRPPQPGIVRGTPPQARTARPPKTKAAPPAFPRILEGKVPDLPVDPSLPPEKEFPASRAKTAPLASPPRAAEPPADRGEELRRTARLDARSEFGKPAAPGLPAGRTAPVPSRPDLTPSLGKTVMALASRGGRGTATDAGSGQAVGTDARAHEKGGIAEERGGGAHLTAINAPEIQYISYFAGIKRKIELVWQYPYDAQVRGIQGELTIDFAVGRGGSLEAIELVSGSGHPVLDEEALRAIRKAAPFDPIPRRYAIPSLKIRARFVYEMHALRIR